MSAGTTREHSFVSLGIDLGTSSAKAVLVDLEGRIRGQASAPYAVRSVRPGWAETDPREWWEAVRLCVGTAVAAAGVQPQAIGLSGQMHGLVLIDADLDPVRPAVLWADGRAAHQVEAYRALDPAARQRLANPLVPGMAGPILAWLCEHEPDAVARARWAVQPKDWLRAVLTGEVGGEPSDASATLLYDVAVGRWDDEVLAALGLPSRLLPPLFDHSGALAGRVDAAAAAALGVPEGIPVAAGAADTAAAAFGNGTVEPGQVQLSIGTGAQIVRPVSTPVDRAADGVHLYRSAAPASWYQMAATTNAGLALTWVTTTLGVDWAELYGSAGNTVQLDDPIFVPHLTGERTPYLDTGLRASWTGLALTHDRAALLRSALEGVAFAIAEALGSLLDDNQPDQPDQPGPPAQLRLAGGGTIHVEWRQLVCDAVGFPLYATDTADASGRGAALLGAVAAGELTVDDATGRLAPSGRIVAEPDPSRCELLAERRQRYHRVVAALSTEGHS